jgi:NADP-dependent aldehyde dehydrogenase
MLVPLGTAAVFSASNFPFAFAVAGGDAASAFAAGCPVIVKGHPSHPATSELFGRAINRAVATMDFPAGFFSLLQGESIEVGQGLVTHPGITAVGFTGSLRAGRAIYDAAAARPEPIPVYAEMGSVNPIVILPGAIAEGGRALVDGLVGSLTLGAGQFCTNPGLIFVLDGPEGQAFIAGVTKEMAAKQPGPLLNANVEKGVARSVAHTLERPAVQRLTGGEVVDGPSFCYANTVMQVGSAAFRADPDLQEEHFGPVTLFVVCRSPADLLDTVENLQGNLTATVHAGAAAGAGEETMAARLFDRLREKAGRLIWNGFPTGVEVVQAMQHGGPYPATTAPGTTSVGMTAIKRFMRPVAFQALPDDLLPPALQDANPLGIWRIVDDAWTRETVGA